MNIWVKGKEQLYQWDIAQELELDGDAEYVDFGTEDEPIRVAVTDGSCPIPDEWLQTPGYKSLWICRSDDTREAVMLSVRERPLPPDYAYTPTQKITFESLVQTVTDAVTNLEHRVEAGEFNGSDGEKGEKGDPREVVQDIGQSTEAVMSQKAVTDCLESKVEKPTSVSSVARLYGVGTISTDTVFFQVQTSNPYKGSIPKRGENGTFAVGTPTNPTDAVNKEYVDGIFKPSFIGTVPIVDSTYDLPEEARIVTAVCTSGEALAMLGDGEYVEFSAGENPGFITMAQIGSIRIVQTGEVHSYGVLNDLYPQSTYFYNGSTRFNSMSGWVGSYEEASLDIYIGR